MSDTFQLGECTVQRGQRATVQIPVARLPTQTMVDLPVTVVRGLGDGPTVGVSAAIHGDEINGVEIIRQLLKRLDGERLDGTILAAPIVNVFGFIHQSRYLPDRRDLNRSFPGSRRGSLTARLAHTFIHEVVERCAYVLDLHTAAVNRTNLPQVRADLNDPDTREIALAFAPPIVMHGKPPAGSLRRAAGKLGVRTLVYEGGEVLRFDDNVVNAGVAGCLRVLAHLKMVDPSIAPAAPGETHESRSSRWVRAPRSGLIRLRAGLGARVRAGDQIAVVSDPLGETTRLMRSPVDGIVIGCVSNPIVNRGDAVAHIGTLTPPE